MKKNVLSVLTVLIWNFPAWAVPEMESRRTFQCLNPIPLHDGLANLAGGRLEASVEWTQLPAAYPHSRWSLTVIDDTPATAILSAITPEKSRFLIFSNEFSFDTGFERAFAIQLPVRIPPGRAFMTAEVRSIPELLQLIKPEPQWLRMFTEGSYIFVGKGYAAWITQPADHIVLCLPIVIQAPMVAIEAAQVKAALFDFSARANLNCEWLLNRPQPFQE